MIIDLTQPLNNATPVYPGDPEVKVDFFANAIEHGFNLSQTSYSNHAGTHIQSGYDTSNEGRKLSDYVVTDFVNDTMLIDVSGKMKITKQDLGILTGGIGGKGIVFMTRYNENKLGQADYFETTPELDIELVEYLVNKNVKLIGIDSHSICSGDFTQYKLLGAAGVLVLEGLVNLEQTSRRFKLHSAPLLMETEASPVRAYAEF